VLILDDLGPVLKTIKKVMHFKRQLKNYILALVLAQLS
jgi:hypothetical protein